MKTFMDFYRVGLAEADDVDIWLETWLDRHDTYVHGDLLDHLGMTQDEFEIWSETGKVVG